MSHTKCEGLPGDHEKVAAFFFDSDKKKLRVLNQILLPKSIRYVDIPDIEAGRHAIESMMVRGAPCIAAVGCLSIIAELNQQEYLLNNSLTCQDLIDWLKNKSTYLISSRPTAVNLRKALYLLIRATENQTSTTPHELIRTITDLCIRAVESGEALNRDLGRFGAHQILSGCIEEEKVTVLTHCNTGALATVGYGTALGVIRSLHNFGRLERAYCTETRPYNQGSRLTAWELVKEKIPATLIADSMVAYLMATRKINAVLVGADCVAANGDTANKIGTLQIAVSAKHYGVPFYVAAPTQSIDLSVKDQSEIKIEQRPSSELRCIGNVDLAPEEIDVWNPCFDVTPSDLITSIITEYGVCDPDKIEHFISNVNSSVANKRVQGLF